MTEISAIFDGRENPLFTGVKPEWLTARRQENNYRRHPGGQIFELHRETSELRIFLSKNSLYIGWIECANIHRFFRRPIRHARPAGRQSQRLRGHPSGFTARAAPYRFPETRLARPRRSTVSPSTQEPRD